MIYSLINKNNTTYKWVIFSPAFSLLCQTRNSNPWHDWCWRKQPRLSGTSLPIKQTKFKFTQNEASCLLPLALSSLQKFTLLKYRGKILSYSFDIGWSGLNDKISTQLQRLEVGLLCCHHQSVLTASLMPSQHQLVLFFLFIWKRKERHLF